MRRTLFAFAAASFHAADLTVQRLTENPSPLPPMKGVKLGTIFTLHMLEIDCKNGAWDVPLIVPFHNFDMPYFDANTYS